MRAEVMASQIREDGKRKGMIVYEYTIVRLWRKFRPVMGLITKNKHETFSKPESVFLIMGN